MMHAEWLPVLMQASFSEIYVIDCATLQFVQVNQSASDNLQFESEQLLGKTPVDISGNLTVAALESALRPLREGLVSQVTLETTQVRKDGSTYPIEYRYCLPSSKRVFIAIGNDIGARHEAARALDISETRFRAIVSNTPGLVFQLLLRADGGASFPYLSEGCHALLGISAERLCRDSERFISLILPEDRPAYLESRERSASELRGWNWEGRVWVEEWNDIKWINLRASPRRLAEGAVQWEGIMTNISDSKLEQAEIMRSCEQLAELSAHVETVKEKERTRIAREIHDDLGGNLTAIKMALALLTRRLPADDGVLFEKAAYVDSLVDRTIEAVHRISGDLRPGILDFGLVAGIAWQAKEFEKQLGIPCVFSSNKEEVDLDPDRATALFRIFQEALTNIGKHAQATRVAVRLACNGSSVQLNIADNGRGMSTSDRLKPGSFGIRGMAERVSALGGNLTFDAGANGGTSVAISIPLPESDVLRK